MAHAAAELPELQNCASALTTARTVMHMACTSVVI
jgi:hypothetical protein